MDEYYNNQPNAKHPKTEHTEISSLQSHDWADNDNQPKLPDNQRPRHQQKNLEHKSLSDSWIRENSATVDRVLAVSSSVSQQIFGDIYIQCRSTRPMPMYSVPGLIDHH